MSDLVRNYRDNFDFKSLTTDILIPKYFPDQDISTRFSGLLGLTTEQLSVISEDTFNAVSTLLKEMFITKASIPKSIYNYASIFQLSNVIGSAAKCKFLLVMEEPKLASAFNEANSYYNSLKDVIYISKNTIIYVDELPFTLDYDIEITRKKTKLASTDYVYGAKYVTTEYTNSISDITNPYIKIRRGDGNYFGLEVLAHQCERTVVEENIVSNSNINYPVVDIPFDGILGGFDAFYKAPGDEDYTQLLLRVENSLPEKDPFCYYKLIDTNKLRLSFSLNDSYFQPEFNSQLRIILYTTKGKEGNFKTYDSDSGVRVVRDPERFNYSENFTLGAVVASSSSGGMDNMSIEDLRRIVVTQFRTATVLSTDNDLELYFENYETTNTNTIKFIKRRDDLVDRLYSGYLVLRNNDYIYPTNTLDISLNYTYLSNPDGGVIYTLDPGHLFVYESKGRVKPLYKEGYETDKAFTATDGSTIYQNIRRNYFEWLNDINPEINSNFDPSLDNWNDGLLESKETNETFKYYIENELCTCNHCGYQTHKMILSTSDALRTCPICGSTDITKGNSNITDFMCSVFDIDEIENGIADNKFVYANPFLMSITKKPGIVSYYLTIINQTSLLDFINYNVNVPLQFIANTAIFERPLSRAREYHVTFKMLCSLSWNPEILIPGISSDDYIPRRSKLSENFVRVMMVIMDSGVESCYLELVPTSIDEDEIITFEATFRTNDHVTLGNQMQLYDYSFDELGYRPTLQNDMGTEFTLNENEIQNIWTNNTNNPPSHTHTDNDEEDENNEFVDNSGIHGNFVYITNKHTKLIPMNNIEIKFVVLSKEVEEDQRDTNNYPARPLLFGLYNYQWTNIYSTFSDRVDFIKPLTMVRSNLYFRDDRLLTVQYGDIFLYSSPFVKYSLLQHYDSLGKLTKNENGLTNFELFSTMIEEYHKQYEHLESILGTTICQASGIDLKFFNTYGKSKNYMIGENDEIIDRVNLSISFIIYLIKGTDIIKVKDEIKLYIKEKIENLNKQDALDFHVSNLIRAIENNFAYIDHIKFRGINGTVREDGTYDSSTGYDTDYQSIRNIAKNLDELTKEERFQYVPEMLCINKDQVSIMFIEEE